MQRRLGINKNKMNKFTCCKNCAECGYGQGIFQVVGCLFPRCSCHVVIAGADRDKSLNMNNQTWEEEFDDNWHLDKEGETTSINENIKQFISELLQEEREKTIKWSPVRILDFARKQGFTAGYKQGREEILKWAEENEYCSRCCSPKKFCKEWGKYASAIATSELLEELQKLIQTNETKI